MAYPTSPIDGQIYNDHQYNSAKSVWELLDKQYMSGQIGTSAAVPIGKVPFDDFWTNVGDISYDSGTRRFTFGKSGTYRLTLNCFMQTSVPSRVVIGYNTDTPAATNHFGMVYNQGTGGYEVGTLCSVITVSAGDYIIFYVIQGAIYNATNDRFNQFTIERIG